MKKLLLFTSAFLSVIAISLSSLTYTFSSPGGAPAGATGSPGDNNLTCARSGCHSGTANPQSGLISTDVPSSGYVPGQTYQITVSITQAGISKWGFQASPQSSNGTLLGTLTLTETSRTRFIGTGNKYVTHTTGGNSGATGSTSWSFNWTAPSTGTGPVTFYTAAMAANGNNGTSGDQVYFDNLVIEEDVTISINDNQSLSDIILYPNPAQGSEMFIKNLKSDETLTIRDMQGKTVLKTDFSGNNLIQSINIENLPKGAYTLEISSESGSKIKRFIRQ